MVPYGPCSIKETCPCLRAESKLQQQQPGANSQFPDVSLWLVWNSQALSILRSSGGIATSLSPVCILPKGHQEGVLASALDTAAAYTIPASPTDILHQKVGRSQPPPAALGYNC